MTDCVFCQIIRKKIPSNIVYEDETVISFLSNRPVNVGHTLVVPKKHYNDIFGIPDNEISRLFAIVKHIAQAVKDSSGAEGIRIVQNNGEAAGQVIFHLHVHIIPLNSNDRFGHDHAFRNPTSPRDSEDLEKDAEEIRQKLHIS